jgi:glycosyltransferase involved in cell wall biosynthesis
MEGVNHMLVEFISDFTAVSGYGNAARSTLRAMLEAGVNVNIKLNAHDTNHPAFDKYWSKDDKLNKLITKGAADKTKPDVRLWLQTPNMIDIIEEGVKNICWTLWETSKIVDFSMGGNDIYNWVHMLNKVDEVWTSCESSKKAFIDSGVVTPIKVVGHPRDWTKYKKVKSSGKFRTEGLDDDMFKFLAVSQWTPRKGFDELILAYLCEFTKEDKTNLILKTYCSNFSDAQIILGGISRIRNSLCKNNGSFPQISLLFKNIPEEDMPELYAMSDCFILTTKGEGFGMPLVEAMGSEMLCITPNHTAMQDYVTDDNALLLKNWREECISGMPGMHVYNSDQYWYVSNTKEIREQMRSAYNMDKKDKERYGKNARDTVVSQYSFDVLGKKMKQMLEESVGNSDRAVILQG